MRERDIEEVRLPDGNSFDRSDWQTYSDEYRKKPVVVRALRLEVPVRIATLEGEMNGKVGSWLVQGVSGEFYPVEHEIFKQTYERVKK